MFGVSSVPGSALMGSSMRAETNFARLPGAFATNAAISDEQLQLPLAAPA
jgi:hypothetical protein